jgi:uncharacterized protein (TIGR02271 family)
MAKTVVGFFNDYAAAQDAAAALEQEGFTADDVSMMAAESTRDAAVGSGGTRGKAKRGDVAKKVGAGAAAGGIAGLLVGIAAFAIPGVGPIVGVGPIATALASAGIGAAAGGLIGALTRMGVPEEHARYYEEGIKRGGTLLAVHADDGRAEVAADILARNGAVDVERQAQRWAESSSGQLSDNVRRDSTGEQSNGEQSIPVVQEELEVGKREVEAGRVRIYSTVVEQPVQEQVDLREEHVRVERRPVDREVDPRALDEFRDQEIELTERAERAVVSKTARVVEEVVVNKEVTHRPEVISDTVRRTEVEVEQSGASRRENRPTFEMVENDFRSDWDTTYSSQGGTYDDWAPAYRYGYDLRNDARFEESSWDDVESDARTRWEAERPGTWEKMKNAVRYAYERMIHPPTDRPGRHSERRV